MKEKLFALFLFLVAGSAGAGPGHDHGPDAPVAAAGAPSPRFTANSDLFEVVGILSSQELSVFVDRFASNEPITQGKVEIESGAYKGVGVLHNDIGDFVFPVKAFANPGSYPITLTVTAGDDVDILAGNLVVPDPHAGHDHSIGALFSLRNILIAAAGMFLLLIAALLIRSRLRSAKLGGKHV
jgi:membrane fusion protein, heavy metal efflux system